MSVLSFIKQHITRYRDRLANISRRNKELYYRDSHSHCINLTKYSNYDNAHEQLVQEQFVPLRSQSSNFQSFLDENLFNLDKHFLINETQNAKLIKRLDKIRLADKNFRREFGMPGAWVLGPFLCWRMSPDYQADDLLISPIFKLSASISKEKKNKWYVELEESNLTINPSLRVALRLKCGIDLPEQFESEDVSGALKELELILSKNEKRIIYDESNRDTIPKIPPRFKSIKDENDEVIERVPANISENLSVDDLAFYNKVTNQQFVVLDVLYLDHLNANRVVLLRDYDRILEEDGTHPILSELFLGKSVPIERGESHERIRELDVYKERENYFVVNSDSAQHRAIDECNQRHAVVIQGPPGTGKSQTITNLISNCLARGKKVLFVSEKRAALDVVHARLQRANLASQAVLIHSSDLNKQTLYNSFLELAGSVHDDETEKQWNLITSDLDRCKTEINCYYNTLAVKHDVSGLEIAELFALAGEINSESIDFDVAGYFSRFNYIDLVHILKLIDELQNSVRMIPRFSDHPWLNRKKQVIYTETLAYKVSELVKKIRQNEELLVATQNCLIEHGATKQISTTDLYEFERISSENISSEWIDFIKQFGFQNNKIDQYQIDLEKIIFDIEKLKTQLSMFNQNIEFDLNEIKCLEIYYSQTLGMFSFLTLDFWKMKKLRTKYLKTWDGTAVSFQSYRSIISSVAAFINMKEHKFLPLNVDENSHEQVLSAYSLILPNLQHMRDFISGLQKLNIDINFAANDMSFDKYQAFKEKLRNIIEFSNKLERVNHEVSGLKSDLNGFFEVPLDIQPDGKLYDDLLNTIKDLDLLDVVDLWLVKLDHIISKEFIVGKLLPLNLSWSDYIHDIVVRSWLDEVRTLHPELRTFNKDAFHKTISEFIRLEDAHRGAAREYVNNTLYKRWNKGIGEREGLSLLEKEANKKKKVLPPREIMEKGALSAMLKLKPCWMMSPISISQILPMEKGLFDTIIFDEASQVRVEEAIPSIYRANSMVVVGDLKQMPPTNFFAGAGNSDDDEDAIEMSPSILDLASQIYPADVLNWHYRSRSEALIAFSNRAFYGGRLIAVPNPNFITEGGAIRFNQINDAYYSKDEGNIIEADAVIERLFNLLIENSNRSFGVIAMGQPQMLAIEEAIDRRKAMDRNFNSVIEKAENYNDNDVHAGLFVKNLENVQGDERDIILISVGYAAHSPGKKVYMNFGPLSKSGGGCRLNVAITRAKQKVEVFCSFDPAVIATEIEDFSKNPDLVLFGRYLKYTKAIYEKRQDIALSILDSFGIGAFISTRKSSNFSKNVKYRLEELGYKVSAEIGSSGFYVDLAVHHPVIESNFIIGIECDGAFFHSNPYVRDRDKIRQELLESRGWKIIRVWSQDWSKNWRSELSRLDFAIKNIINTNIKNLEVV